jgi:hypothetical protein
METAISSVKFAPWKCNICPCDSKVMKGFWLWTDLWTWGFRGRIINHWMTHFAHGLYIEIAGEKLRGMVMFSRSTADTCKKAGLFPIESYCLCYRWRFSKYGFSSNVIPIHL